MRTGHKVEISHPQRGEKREIVEMAVQNAREQLARRIAENSAQRELLDGVAEVFGLETPPQRIEVYDNSHIQGSNAVGGMIVAGPDGFEKGEYRKFNIKSAELTPGDDYAMMREVLTRRFARLVKEEGDPKTKWPDLALIDGGPGQVVGRLPGLCRSWRRGRDAGRHFQRARIATQVASISTFPAASRSGSIPKVPFSTTCSACATRRTASPSARIARSAPRRSAPIRWTRSRASALAASARCCSISVRRGPWPAPA